MNSNLSMEKISELITEKVKAALRNSNIIPLQVLSDGKNKTDESQSAEKNINSGSSFKLLNKKLIVEEDVKAAMKNGSDTLEISRNAIVTPLAKDMILHKKINLIKK